MSKAGLIGFFSSKERMINEDAFRRTSLFIRASLLTSLFSATYLLLSISFEFDAGIKLMIFNVVGFLFLPFLLKTRLSINIIGNIYVFVGASAVILLAFASGGVFSAIYPWIISIPILALLVVNRNSAIIWGSMSFLAMLGMGIAAINGFQFMDQMAHIDKAIWFTVVQPGLLLIIFFIAYIFQLTQSQALHKLKARNQTIAQQKEALNELIDEKNYIIRVLSHDLRGPLRNIQGLVKLLDLETDESRLAELKDLMLTTSLNAENLVNRVLEMDKSENSAKKVDFSRIDMISLLSQIVANIEEIAKNKHMSINTVHQLDQAYVYAEATYMRLIFDNLLSNAIKFSEDGASIEVRIEEKEDKLLFSIIDQGQGIDESEEDKLFKKFSKLSAKPTAGESSTGLGLSLVKIYVELCNGQVWYEKNPSGKGSIFKVELPSHPIKG